MDGCCCCCAVWLCPKKRANIVFSRFNRNSKSVRASEYTQYGHPLSSAESARAPLCCHFIFGASADYVVDWVIDCAEPMVASSLSTEKPSKQVRNRAMFVSFLWFRLLFRQIRGPAPTRNARPDSATSFLCKLNYCQLNSVCWCDFFHPVPLEHSKVLYSVAFDLSFEIRECILKIIIPVIFHQLVNLWLSVGLGGTCTRWLTTSEREQSCQRRTVCREWAASADPWTRSSRTGTTRWPSGRRYSALRVSIPQSTPFTTSSSPSLIQSWDSR